MYFKRTRSMLLVIAMLFSLVSFSSAASAADTEVLLNVTNNSLYEIIIPETLVLNENGTATPLSGGVVAKSTNMQEGKRLNVDITGSDNWRLTMEDSNSTIEYAIYGDEGCSEAVTSLSFNKDELMADGGKGTTRSLWVKPEFNDIITAEVGSYSGTITFTAEIRDALREIFTEGSVSEFEIVAHVSSDPKINGKNMYFKYVFTKGKMKLLTCTVDGVESMEFGGEQQVMTEENTFYLGFQTISRIRLIVNVNGYFYTWDNTSYGDTFELAITVNGAKIPF